MTPRIVRQWLTRVGLVGGATLVLAGCPEDAADITEQASEPSFDFPVASAFVEPAGEFSVDNITLAAFDTTVSDAFGTSVAGAGGTFTSDNFGCCGAWDLDGFDRNSSTDPRLPALADADAFVDPGDDNLVILDPSGICGADCPFHNPFGGVINNLPANDMIIVAFFRYELQVNGELDAAAVAQGDPVTAPDQLVLAGGSGPAGNPNLNIEVFPTFTAPIPPDANPLILGFFNTDGTGAGAFDVIVDGTNVLYQDISATPADASFDSALVARNDDTQTTFPRYNYMVLLDGPAVDAADAADNDQLLRWQIGQDMLASSGAPINNAYAPFPLTFSTAALVGAPGGAGRPDSLTATFNNLEALAGGATYEAWLVNPETGSMVPAVGDYQKRQIEIELDPVTGEVVSIEDTLVVESTAGTASFVGDASGQGFRHDLIVSDNTLAPDTLGLHTHLVLTTTSSPGGSTIPSSRPLWFQFTDQNGTPDNFFDDTFNPDAGATSFGNFDPADASNSRIYIGVGQGTGGVRALDRDAESGLVTSGILSVDLQALSRPPVGYELQGWVVSEDGSQAFPTDPITGPGPEFVDITTADAETIQGIVTQNGILNANFRLNSAEAGVDFTNFFNFMVTLEPKAGIAGMGPIPVQSGVLPGEVTTPVGGE